MDKISTFYRDFFTVIILFIIFGALFGIFNDMIVHLLSKSSVSNLMETYTVHRYLFFLQMLGVLAVVFVLYRNNILVFWKVKRQKLTTRTTSIVISVSSLLIFLPYFVLFLNERL